MGKTCQCPFSPRKLPLPKLPVPGLQDTMDKYLTLLRTVVSPQDLARATVLVEEFCAPGGLGRTLQERLLKRQQATDNWANDWWLHDMYLNVRLPLTINSNPAAVFLRQSFPSRPHQLRFAAKLVCGILDFKRLLDTRTLPVERCKYKEAGQPLCMEQHYRLFSCYRQPGNDVDVQRTDLGTPGREFIVVACNNKFFQVDVQRNGQYVSDSDLSVQLSRVVAMATDNHLPREVGLLTSLPRDEWADARECLLQDASNRATLHALENCLFMVCLDKAAARPCRGQPVRVDEDMSARTEQIIHGGGASNNSANRWMDKTIQVIVAEDGTCGINMEHSVAEGIALGHVIEHAFGTMARGKESAVTSDPESLPYPLHLDWNLSPRSLEDVHKARRGVDRLVQDFDLSVFRFRGYGRDFIKGQGMSPDAYIQLALQLTYYKIHGALTSTYESASVRRFRQGRVDVVRANSPAACAWVKAMLGNAEHTVAETAQLFLEAVHWQQEYTLNTVLGGGIDLHLLGLREAAAQQGGTTPEIFTEPSFKEFNTFRLSTSQVPTISDYWMGYGAVVPDGYGCCYNPQADHVTFSVATFVSQPDTSADMFANTLESSLLQIAELLCASRPQRTADQNI